MSKKVMTLLLATMLSCSTASSEPQSEQETPQVQPTTTTGTLPNPDYPQGE